MKFKIVFLFLLSQAIANAQNYPYEWSGVITVGVNDDCVSDTTFGAWVSTDAKTECAHQWIYKYHEPTLQIVNPDDCNCGNHCNHSNKEARICRTCLRHESRVVEVIWHKRLTEYEELLKKKNEMRALKTN